jgi:uncharacterized protein HemX
MSATLNAPTQWTTSFSLVETLGLMTVAMGIALILIAVGYRMIKTMTVLRKYDEAVEKVQLIEAKTQELQALLTKAEIEYQRDLAELTHLHSKECFDLQQVIFERNGEVLELKNKLLMYNMNSPI